MPMKSNGGTKPRTGWFQRTRASTDVMRPLVASTSGW
jgi:hypothetical protein